ncbi:MAG: DUF1440 domain-containing protein [Chloroflexi bacterium]|nr:DUF1440 domain-containing protein [Chloroflexota bacterium]
MVGVAQREHSLGEKVVGGIVGGVIGGIGFGILMGLMGMFPTIAGLVGSTSAVVGFLIHMLISVFIGGTFGLIFGSVSTQYPRAALWGLIYGIAWWILGPMVIMPTMMGMGPQFAAALSGPMLMSLMGHMVYGILAGLGYAWYALRLLK